VAGKAPGAPRFLNVATIPTIRAEEKLAKPVPGKLGTSGLFPDSVTRTDYIICSMTMNKLYSIPVPSVSEVEYCIGVPSKSLNGGELVEISPTFVCPFQYSICAPAPSFQVIYPTKFPADPATVVTIKPEAR